MINADGTNLDKLTSVDKIEWSPVWSYDKTKIIYATNPSYRKVEGIWKYDSTIEDEIWTMNSDGSNKEFLINGDDPNLYTKEYALKEQIAKCVQAVSPHLCYTNLAKLQKDTKICDKINRSENDRYSCYTRVAEVLGESAICSKIPNLYEKQCYIEIAKFFKDPLICAKMAEIMYTSDIISISIQDISQCFVGVAEIQKDFQVCEEIQKYSLSGVFGCYKKVGGAFKSFDVCENLQSNSLLPEKIKHCKFGAAVALQDINLCEKVYNKTKCLSDIAIISKNPMICEQIYVDNSSHDLNDQYTKDRCYLGTAVEQKDPRICEKIKIITIKEECYEAVAAAPQSIFFYGKIASPDKNIMNIKECENIVDPDSRDRKCIIDLAQNFADPQICKKTTFTDNKNLCFWLLSWDLKDFSLCDKIEDEDASNPLLKDWCYKKIAKFSKNLTVCGKIKDIGFRDWCYKDIAVDLKDISVCNGIEESEYKDICFMAAEY